MTFSSHEPNAQSLAKAEKMWYKELQEKHFTDVIEYLQQIGVTPAKHIDTKCIMRAKKLVAPSISLSLNLFLNPDGIVRLNTSLAGSTSLPYDLKFPILLPRDDHVTRLLIKHYHISNGHAGVQQSLSCIRLQYWIPKLGKLSHKY